MTLKELKIGESAVITSVGGEGALRQHFLDMGVIPGTEITLVKFAPMGDPMELLVRGYKLTLRLADADKIEIEPVKSDGRETKKAEIVKTADHPGLGEVGYGPSDRDQLHDRAPREAPRLCDPVDVAALDIAETTLLDQARLTPCKRLAQIGHLRSSALPERNRALNPFTQSRGGEPATR